MWQFYVDHFLLNADKNFKVWISQSRIYLQYAIFMPPARKVRRGI